jgi:CRISPR/Cas system CSM-associated protein Csm3 (group 7 of RAMP superfamily)
VAKGTLILNTKKQLRVKFTNGKGNAVEMAVPDPELHPLLRQLKTDLKRCQELNGKEVELEEVKGQPTKVRPVGESWPLAVQPSPPQKSDYPVGRKSPVQQQGRQHMPEFHNPYNFVPALPRDQIQGDLGDLPPAGHHRYLTDRFSGVIRVKMVLATPLLLPDAARRIEYKEVDQTLGIQPGHKSFPVRVDADNQPYVPPTSIKGMLRSAYEAVTNSRLAIFAGHDTKVEFRRYDPRTRRAPRCSYEMSPLDLLAESLRPAGDIKLLSPAERLFGWANQTGDGAYRGQLRVGPVICKTQDAIELFGIPGLPLAILAQPRPQQGRFYVAASSNGEAQRDGLLKEEAGYGRGKGLRGRKAYPHQNLLPANWRTPIEDRTRRPDNQSFQEYRRPKSGDTEMRDDQNRSIQGWVRPLTEFSFDLHVTNLSKVEVGGVLWLLSLGDGHFYRLGGGKPFGFGSVSLSIDAGNTHLQTGTNWKAFYSTLDDTGLAEENTEILVRAFRENVGAAYGDGRSFERIPFIAAFLRAAKGFADGLPTHYPRARQQGQQGPVPPHPEGKSFQWFVANDRERRVSLPDLVNSIDQADPGLPMLGAPRGR